MSTANPTLQAHNARPWRLIAGIVLVLLLGAGLAFMLLNRPAQPTAGLPYDPVKPAADFTLIGQNNQTVSLSDFRGKYVLLYFGFTHCPDACPLTLSHWKFAQENLGKRSDQLAFIFITVDPERDTPEQIGRHLALFSPDFIGLTGTLPEIEDVARSYNVFLQKVAYEESQTDYLVNHTTLTFVIDPDGNLIVAFPYETSAEDMTQDLERLIR